MRVLSPFSAGKPSQRGGRDSLGDQDTRTTQPFWLRLCRAEFQPCRTKSNLVAPDRYHWPCVEKSILNWTKVLRSQTAWFHLARLHRRSNAGKRNSPDTAQFRLIALKCFWECVDLRQIKPEQAGSCASEVGRNVGASPTRTAPPRGGGGSFGKLNRRAVTTTNHIP